MKMKPRTSRRAFIKKSTLAGAGLVVAGGRQLVTGYPANEKLNVASVGAGGRAAGDIAGVAGENIVALCDVDTNRAKGTFSRFKDAKKYADYRKMLEAEAKHVDAVVVATPDHVHAPAALMAMRLGKHVYCEKPLTYTVEEARMMRETANKYKVATQMGNQGTSSGGLRRAVDIIRSGGIGPVREVHVWTNRPVWPQGVAGILKHRGVQHGLHGKGSPAKAPDAISWDLWIGPAPWRPYDPIYAPFKWRGWKDFGTGALGDMACHTMNLPYMALKLGAPTSIDAKVSVDNPETYPEWAIVTYEFPARGDMPPVTLKWYDGDLDPPHELFLGKKRSGSGSLLVGTKGRLYSKDDYGSQNELLPSKDFEDYEPPPRTLPKSPGHHAEFIRACKGGPKAMSNFDYAGPLTETVLLGNVAMAVQTKIKFDAKNLRITNNDKANSLLKRKYRKGFSIYA